MRHFPLLLAGGLVLVASAAIAAGDDRDVHEMTVRLPGGGVERIEYTGKVAPHVVFSRDSFDNAWPTALLAPDPAFAAFDRIATEMDREFAAVRARVAALANASLSGQQGLDEAALRNLPPGTTSYSMIATSNGNGFCTQTVEVDRPTNGKPEVVRHSSGNCGAESKGSRSLSGAPANRPENAPIPIRYETTRAPGSASTAN